MEEEKNESKIIDFVERRELRMAAISDLTTNSAEYLRITDEDFEGKAKAISELERYLVEEDKNRETEKHNRFTRIIDAAKVIVTLTVGIGGVISNKRTIDKITRFEEEGPGAFLTQSSRSTVQDALKEKQGIFSRFPKFW